MQKYIILLLVCALCLTGIFVSIKINTLNDQVLQWQNQAASLDSITTYYKTINERLTLKVESISSENKKLNSLLKKKDETIQSQVNLIGELKDSLNNIPTQDTIIYINNTDSSVIAKSFNAKKSPFTLEGFFYITKPYTITFDKISATIDLEINIVQGKNNVYKVYADTKDKSFTLTGISSKVVPYKPTFWEKLNLGIGVLGSKEFISAYGQLYYSHYSVLAGFSNKGWVLGTEYVFRK